MTIRDAIRAATKHCRIGEFRVLAALVAVALGLGVAPSASADVQWTCGAWTTESPTKSCRTCTRSVCDTSGKTLDKCHTETRTECSVPEPGAKAGAPGLLDHRGLNEIGAGEAVDSPPSARPSRKTRDVGERLLDSSGNGAEAARSSNDGNTAPAGAGIGFPFPQQPLPTKPKPSPPQNPKPPPEDTKPTSPPQ